MRPGKAAIPDEGWQSLRRRNALLPRVALLLTLALLPLGIIAVAQTQHAIETARQTYRASLSAQTARLAQPESDAIQNAQGITRGLSDALAVLAPTDVGCMNLMRYSAARNDQVVFLGFIGTSRLSVCNNLGKPIDFSDLPQVQTALKQGTLQVTLRPSGGISGKPVVIVQQPVYSALGVFKGLVMLSLLSDDLVAWRKSDQVAAAAVILTFNEDGDVLTADLPVDELDKFLPADTTLVDLVGGGKQLFFRRYPRR
jgi:hypothetical protein